MRSKRQLRYSTNDISLAANLMGLFDWLKRGKPHDDRVLVKDDQIWLTKAAKFRAIAHEIRQAAREGDEVSCVFVIAYFAECLEELSVALAQEDLHGVRYNASLASELTSFSEGNEAAAIDSALIIAAERHPSPDYDDLPMDFARSLPGKCQVNFHSSLDDDLHLAFAGQKTQATLRQFGAEENEPISGWMVSRSLTRARKKIAKCVVSDYRAHSAREWILKNCPELVPGL